MEKKVRSIEYECSLCGERKIVQAIAAGKPLPGYCRKNNNGPHKWKEIRKIKY